MGAEHIISPLGKTAEANFKAASEGVSSIKEVNSAGYEGKSIFLSRFENEPENINSLISEILEDLQIDRSVYNSQSTKVIICSTKGNLKQHPGNSLASVYEQFSTEHAFKNNPLVISNACISGTLGIAHAHELVRNKLYENVIVIGADLISDFVIYGFESLFALDHAVCKPFDKNRKGINLGEACAAVVISAQKEIYEEEPMELLGGSSANDANHISGPSRTGEGLYRTVKKTLAKAQLKASEINYISAHGTATTFNDAMEAIAFGRLRLSDVPLNSLKAYFGHTLGAAGVLETAMAIQSLRKQRVLKSLGFNEAGEDKPLNIIENTEGKAIETVLKTSSGFGGANASIIMRKL